MPLKAVGVGISEDKEDDDVCMTRDVARILNEEAAAEK